MSDHNELIAQFVSMTSAPESQAQFYLEMSEWNLEVNTSYIFTFFFAVFLVYQSPSTQVAVTQFFDNAGAAGSEEEEEEAAPETASSGPSMATTTTAGSGSATHTKRKAAP